MRAVALAAALLAAAPAWAQDAVPGKTGAQIYRQFCSHCHGPNMVNAGTSSYDLRRFPTDEEERFRHSVINGKNNMPPWGSTLSGPELDKIWDYVRMRGQP